MTRKKASKALAIVLTVLMFFSMMPDSAAAEQASGSITVKGAEQVVKFTIGQKSYKKGNSVIETDIAPYIKDDRTMVPASFVANALGADSVKWVPEKKTVEIKKDDKLVIIKIGSKELLVNGTPLMMDTTAEIRDVGGGGGRTMVPIAFIAKALDVGYQWDNSTKSVEFYGYKEILGSGGNYGPAAGSEIIKGNVIIAASGVRLQNRVIKGNLVIEESVGKGDVFLDNVIVEGNTYIRGGGRNSIHINGGMYHGKVIVENAPEGGIRVVVKNAEGVNIVIATGEANEEIILEGNFSSVEISAANAVVSTQGQTTIENMIINSKARVTLGKSTTVKNTIFNAAASVYAYGTMDTINVNSEGVVIYTNTPPKTSKVSPGISPARIVGISTPDSSAQTSGSGGGGRSRRSGGDSDSDDKTTTTYYTLTYTAGPNGSITGESSQRVVRGGSGTEVTAVPNEGYHFVSWSDGSADNPRRDTNVTKDISVMANFEANSYTLTVEANPPEGGTVTGGGAYKKGEEATVTATASEGYSFVNWTIEGIGQSTNTNYTFLMPPADTTIVANFTPDAVVPATYILTLSGEGLASVPAAGQIEENTPVTITVTPPEGKQVASFTANGIDKKAELAGDPLQYSFIMAADTEVAVTYEDIPVTMHTLTYTAGPNGSITGEASQTVAHGGSGTEVEAVPNTGYHFVSWSDGSTDNPRTDTNVTGDISVTANFEINTYTLTYTAGPNGSITGEASQTVAHGGSGTEVTAVPNEGYHFVSWSDGSTDNPRTDTNVTRHISVTASFEANSYTLTVEPNPPEGGAVTGGGVYKKGEEVTVTASVYEGYSFKNWTIEGIGQSTSANYTFLMPPADTTIVANFTLGAVIPSTYTLTLSGEGLASVPAAGQIEENTPVIITVTPPEGKQVASFTVNGIDKKAELAGDPLQYSFIMASDTEVAVTYEDIPGIMHTLTYTAGPNGSITGETSQTVAHGGSGTEVEAVPNTGYHFVSWSDGSTDNPRTDTNVTEDISVTANFEINTYTLTYTAGPNGSITGETSQTVAHGGSGTEVEAVPNTGYHFVSWSDGSTDNPRTDTNVTKHISVTANFAENAPVTYTLTVEANPPEGGTVTGGGMYEEGEKVEVTATANDDYSFVNWTVGSEEISTSASFEYTMPAAKTTLVANFIQNTIPSNLVLWLDAKDYDGSTGTWTDKSGKNNTVVQSSESSRPSKVANGLNGKPVVQFDGSDDYLNLNWSGGSLTADSMTIFMVLKHDDMTSSTSRTVMGNFATSGNTGDIAIHKSGSEKLVYGFVHNRSHASRVDFGDDTGPYVLTWQYDDGTSTHRAFINGVLKGSAVSSVDIDWDDTAIGRSGISVSGSSRYPWKGYIAEIRIYDSALGTEDRKAVEAELNTKWSIYEEYTVTFDNPENGSLTAAVDGTSISSGSVVQEGSDIVFTVVPDEGYTVDCWKVNDVIVEGETGLTYTHENLSDDIEVEVVLKVKPVTPPNLVLHLDASDYNESTGTWTDKSGKNNTVVQSSESSRPSKVANGLNGKPVVQFDGSDDYLNLNWSGGSLTADSMTIFMVLKHDDMTSSTSRTVMGNFATSGNTGDIAIHKSGSEKLVYGFVHNRSHASRVDFGDDTGPYILTWQYDDGTSTHRAFINGVLKGSAVSSVDIDWDDTAIGRSGISVSGSSSRYPWKGYIAEIRIYDSALSTTQRQTIETELQNKWLNPENP